MSTQTPLPKSIIPDLPRINKMINEKGEILDTWRLFFDQLVLALQTNLTPNGWLIPKIDITQINAIQAKYTPLIGAPLPVGVPDITGQLVFDITNSIMKQFIIEYDALGNITVAQWFTIVDI